MKQGNRVLKRILSNKIFLIILMAILCTSGVIVYAAKNPSVPDPSNVKIEHGETDDEASSTTGTIKNYSGYNSAPVAWVYFKIINKNTAKEAAEYIINNIQTTRPASFSRFWSLDIALSCSSVV